MRARLSLSLLLFGASAVARADTYEFAFSGANGAQCQASGATGSQCLPTLLFAFDWDLSTGPTSYNANSADYLLESFGTESEFTLGAQGFGINFDTSQTWFLGPSDGFSADAGGATIASGPWSNLTVFTGNFYGGTAYVYGSTEFYDTDTLLTIKDLSQAQAPEPSTLTLASTGLLAAAGIMRRKTDRLRSRMTGQNKAL